MGCKACMQKIPIRYYIITMIFLTTYINYTTRSNFSMSLPAMVQVGKKAAIPECTKDEAGEETANKTAVDDTGPKYDWDQKTQGLLLAAYFYGYLAGSIPAGMVAENLGPFWTIFSATVVAGIFNSVCVWVAPLHWGALFAARFIIGFSGGLVYPALQCLIGRWAPPDERGVFVGALMGNTIGTCVSWAVVGSVTQKWKWPAGFHVLSGQVGIFLIICWIFVVDTPEKHPWITEKELNFIKSSQEGKVKKNKGFAPYCDIVCSFPFWSLVVLHFGNLWGLYVQITAVPKYMKEFIGYDIGKSGFLSSLPHLLRFFFGIGFGFLGDWFKRRKYKRILILKGCITFSHLIPGILMGCMGFAECHSTIALVLLIFSMSINGAAVMTNLSNPTDLSPNFAGTIFAIISLIGGTTGFIVPSVTGAILSAYGATPTAWMIIFGIGGVVYIACGIFFLIFGVADVQPWNDKKKAEPQAEPENNPAT